MQVNKFYFRKHHYLQQDPYEYTYYRHRLDPQQHFPIMNGDMAAETPSQSNFDNYIVSVQNTRALCQSTKKHIAESQFEHLNTIERCQQTGKIEMSLRYCKECLMDMPLRARHCRLCQKCISTYDHHCPWLGNCIGERNRKHFYVFLWLQEIQLCFMLYLALKCENEKVGLICLIADILFQLFVVYLVIFHSYLAATNTTTWECLSWNKISYL